MKRFKESDVKDPNGLVSVTIKLKDGSMWEIRKAVDGFSAVNPIVSTRVYFFNKKDGFNSTFDVIEQLSKVCLEEKYNDVKVERRLREYLSKDDTRKEARRTFMRWGCDPIGDNLYHVKNAFPSDKEEHLANDRMFKHYCKRADDCNYIIASDDKIFLDASDMDYDDMISAEKELRRGNTYGFPDED